MFFQFTSVGLLRSEMPSHHHACCEGLQHF